MAGSPPDLHIIDSRSACIQGVLKVKVEVKGHVIRALFCILGMSYSVIDGLVLCFIAYFILLVTDRSLMAGRQYDKDGNLRQWWNNDTIKAFRQRAQCIIDQYSSYVLEPLGMHVSTADN